VGPVTYNPGRGEFHARVGPKTIAIAHTHPTRDLTRDPPSRPTPSQADRNAPVPVYVISDSGIWVTDPSNRNARGDRQVRGKDWQKPCSP
jgi:hypothetical protein